nr:nucleolar transcription factor 1-A-like isoform X1 [Procambarus clarkii]XP_045598071.1 nucleolar transcription factor 1-A-like isoform X1 [Procambarus clarkii]XP_045598073.1 nucleolar transcription factor 1-A-like isoform X1 [Procambarus clarkii]
MGKLLSQVDTEASVSPMMNILTEKKKKRKKKGKEQVEESAVQEVTSMESAGMSPKKKKKKKKDIKSQHEILEVVTEKPKKEKKKKKNKKLDEDQNEVSVHSSNSSRMSKDDLSTSADASSPSKSPKTAVESSNKKRMLENSTHSPAKKRKMQKSTERSRSKTVSISEDVNGGVLEPLPWSVEEEEILLEKMKEQLPKKDTKSFRVTLKHLKWDEVAFGGRTAEDCKTKFMEIISKFNAMKSLTMMVQEAKEHSVDYASRKKRVLLPIHRFMKDAIESGKLQPAQKSGGKYLAAVHEAWRNLSGKEKEKYEAEYNEELQRMSVSLKSFGVTFKERKYKVRKDTGLPKTPLEIWCSEQKNEIKGNPSESNYPKVVYAGLEDDVKLKYITSSLREMHDFEKKIEAQKESNPEDNVPQIRGPTKVDLKIYLKAKGLPEDQFTRPFTVFYQELLEAGELDNIQGKVKLMSVMEKFKHLPKDRQTQYKIQALKNKEDYESKLAAWEKKQDELTLYARQKFVNKKSKRVLKKPLVTVKAKMPEVFSNVVHCDSTCPSFHDEPPNPPPTPFKLFCLKCEHSIKQEFETPAQKRSVLAKTWENFPYEKKFAYSRRCEELKEKYEARLIQYVQNMDKKMRKIYLGFRRQNLYLYFKRDIFQNSYPNEKYPVYALSPKKKKKKQRVASESDDDFVAEPVLASDRHIKEGKSKKNIAVEKSQSSMPFKRNENITSKTKKDAKRQLLGSKVNKLDGNNTKYKSKSHVTTSKSAKVANCIGSNSPLVGSDSSTGNERKRKISRDESLEEELEHNKPSSRLSAKRTKPTIITNELESEIDSDVDSDCSEVHIDKKQNSFNTSVEDSVSDDSDFVEDLVKSKPNKLSTEKSPSKKEKSIMTPMKLDSDNSSDEESDEEIEIEKPKPNTFSSKGSPSKKTKSLVTPMESDESLEESESEEEFEKPKPQKLTSKGSPSNRKPILTPKKSEPDESSDEEIESEEEHDKPKPKKLTSKGSPSNKKPVLTLKKSESGESSNEESESEEEHDKRKPKKLTYKGSPSNKKPVLTLKKSESGESSNEESESEEEHDKRKPKKLTYKGSPSNKKPVLTLKKSESGESSNEESESEEEHEKTKLGKSSFEEESVFTPQKLESNDSSDEECDAEVGPAWKSSTSITNYQSSSSSDSD